MRLLILGGTGQLGSALRRTAGPSLDVHATARAPSPTPGATWHALDLREPGAGRALLDELAPDLVVNCAYVMGGDDLRRVTADAPAELAAGPGRFVHLSSDVVFPGDADGFLDEDAFPRPVHAYGQAKLDAERAVAAVDPNALIVRTSLLYGHPGGGPPERQVQDPGFTFFTDEIRHPTHVDDLARALLDAATSGHRGVLHLVGADAVSRHRFAQLLAPSLGVDPTTIAGRPQPPGIARPRRLALISRHTEPLPGCLERRA
jgi:dTDP-4-dehydrorhamnose reductase